MTLLHLFVLALVQGITEFLPISSSGHLILIPVLTGWADQGMVMDVAVHVGTLAAVLIYFHRDTRGLCLAALGSFGVASARRAIEDSQYMRLFRALVIATLPVVMAGLAFRMSGLDLMLRDAVVIGAASILFGLLLYWADQAFPATKTLERMAIRPALLIGLAQMLALIPGTSRAGITMTAGRWLGFSRVDAARFSMLLSIPTIAAAGLLAGLDLAETGISGRWADAALAAGLAFLAALGAIHFLMRWLQHASMTIFVVYRVVLGAALLIWAL